MDTNKVNECILGKDLFEVMLKKAGFIYDNELIENWNWKDGLLWFTVSKKEGE